MKVRLAAIFLVVFLVMLWGHGSRLVFTNDEGIVLEPAQRVANGFDPYTDFFAVMSPGSYYLQALVFRVFGVSMLSGRLLTLFDFAVQCALVFWLTDRFGGRRAAWLTLVCFFGFQIADPTFLTAQHRWDSSTWGLASICLAVCAKKWPHWAAAGALAAVSALCTPSMALLTAATGLWLVMGGDRRPALLPYAAGGGSVTAITVGLMTANGTLLPFLDQLRWLSANYGEVNVMFYGSIIGGWGRLFEDVSGAELVTVTLVAIALALPALLPLVSGAAWIRESLQKRAKPEIALLLLAMATFCLATLPRADIAHLAFGAAIPYALTGAWLARLPARVGAGVSIAGVLLVLLFSSHTIAEAAGLKPVPSPVGVLQVASRDQPAFEQMLRAVPRRSSLYVHPYMPLFYYVTQARNPTRYAFLCPGMTPTPDELRVLADLQRSPPEWVMYLPLRRDDFLRVFPNGGKLNHRFPQVERWIESRYEPVEPEVRLSGYRLWRRKDSVEASN